MKIIEDIFRLSTIAFHKSIEKVGIEIQATWYTSKIYAITKSTVSIAFQTIWK